MAAVWYHLLLPQDLPSQHVSKGIRRVVLGPKAAKTVVVTSPHVLYQIGVDRELPGHPLVVAAIDSETVALAFWGRAELVTLFRTGRFLKTLGGIGTGPGEYQGPMLVVG